MKKLLILTKPLGISILSLLMVSFFLRYYLVVNSGQLLREFKNQNYRELYSMDTLKLSSRMNALSSVINWVCIEGQVNGKNFYKMERGRCSTGLFRQRQQLLIPEANNIQITFTTRLPREVEQLFMMFLLLQSVLILALIKSTKNAEEEKRQNEIKLSKMARQMSHDIRSPLATFNTIIHDLKSIPEEDLNLLNKSIIRISEIADTLLADSRVLNKEFKGVEQKNKEAENIVALIKNVIEEKRLEFKGQNGININSTFELNDIRTLLDPVEFKRIISNLINNAVDAANDENINIEIQIEKLHTQAHVIIKDDGRGISPDVLDKLGKTAVTTKPLGNGLGLQHCFEKIKEWNGSVNISSWPNEGTTIEIFLPIENLISTKAVLIDDDELVKLTWASAAKKHNIELMTISNKNELEKLIPAISKDTHFYIDSDLGNGLRGEQLATQLYSLGYYNIYMASGYTDERFNHLQFLKGVQNKVPPWK